MVQAFNNRDNVNQKTVCENIWKALGNGNIIHILMTDEGNFQLWLCQFSELSLLGN